MLISHYMCTAIIGFAHGRVKKCMFLTVNILRRVLLRIGNDSFVLDVVAIFKHRVLPVTHAHLKKLGDKPSGHECGCERAECAEAHFAIPLFVFWFYDGTGGMDCLPLL